MKKNLIVLAIVHSTLAGCNDEGATGSLPDIIPPTETIPPTDIIPPVTYLGKLTVDGHVIKGDAICHDQKLVDGTFKIEQGQYFSCTLGSVYLGDFIAPLPSVTRTASSSDLTEKSFNLVEQHGGNVTRVLQAINSCEESNTICVTEFDSLDIQDIYLSLDNAQAVNDFIKLKNEQEAGEATDEVDKTPSSHIDPKIKPEETEGVSPDLDSSFVSAGAEDTYAYKPSLENQVLTESRLTDANGRSLAGVSFFSNNSRGVTASDGSFEYLWGDELTFGIDTFEFGSVKGNKVSYKITDVTNNAVEKSNIQSLLERYGRDEVDALVISDNVTSVFAEYPNVINELINLRLPNGGIIDGSDGMTMPDEFERQFESGLTAIIDAKLNHSVGKYSRQSRAVYSMESGTYVTDSLKAIFNNVKTFHVFHDNQGGYGATGWARGNRTLNISNRAFPIMMDRNDVNKHISFGERQVWTREGKPYIAAHEHIVMQAIPTVNSDTATYGLPFVAAGEIGLGKVVFMGNSMYPSILSCPSNYWANGWNEVRINTVSQECTSGVTEQDARSDKGDMQRYFTNLFNWFSHGDAQNVATNIEQGVFAMANNTSGVRYDFFIDESYGFGSVTKVDQGDYASLDPSEIPILILQAYGVDSAMNDNSANLSDPKLDKDDITALINYVNKGGNVLFMDGIDVNNPEPIARLADAAGISIGGPNVANLSQSNCEPGNKWCNKSPRLNQKQEKQIVVLQRFDNLPGGNPPFAINDDGSVTWASDADMASTPFHVPQYEVIDSDGKVSNKYALIRVNNIEEREAAIRELQEAFVGTPVCSNEYEYEFNCIEVRSGTGIVERAYGRPDFERVQFEVSSMVKAANLGTSIQALADHELYYRTGGRQGTRLPITELNQTYDNLSTWLWNNNNYRFELGASQDELGFKRLVQFMNCYTNNTYGGNTECPADLKTTLVANNMIIGEGELEGFVNPSYPLNYQEKPLTRIMLGRSYWDYRIKVDTTSYPTRPDSYVTTSETISIDTDGIGVSFSAGNNQSTGMWLPQHEVGSVSGDTPATITVMFADDLTGRAQHETNLNRPPRMTKTFSHTGGTTQIDTPYGGLVYIQPLESNGIVQYSLNGVIKAPLYKEGRWVTEPSQSSVKVAEIDTGSFIYTTHVNNLQDTDLAAFSDDMNRFADAASDFYGRDEMVEAGVHRRFTYDALKGFRHRFVNDIQISIGAAHSGYPVMSSSFNAQSTTIPTQAKNDWLLWHEVGHNLASAPFNVPGSTEVTNNLLALYMQELEGRNDNPRMDRIIFDIKKAPTWLQTNDGHAWANSDAGMRLVMFGQLKLWAKAHFKIDDWYKSGDVRPSIYGNDEGWNMFKLMHRKARGDHQGDQGINYCSERDTGFSGGDLIMLCSSYVSGYDLADFFTEWNVGETSSTTPQGVKIYSGGISEKALEVLESLKLNKPESDPLEVDSLSYGIEI
ncbi:sugar ABC transporter substrate-binding protein [Vibrio owensii 47666-1]|uniref:SslE/AcfD family lipoprotein zinc metalloprotease n=1 Tax=Vibrio owensii TaxID=696485 RepID=UPI0005847571|nr:SslE/AcfD family lipoprotein zinc metalloprotease [Vibrio owensii]KIF48788.1 sugar ABC transporter substrate-binding protein [Vibrio owensii 47666-1]